MTSTITGIGSGFDISGWISQLVSAKKASTITPLRQKLSALEEKNTALDKLQSKFSTLQSAIKTFTNTMYDSSSDMWTNTKIESSNSAYATATSSGVVTAASVDIEVEQVATATVAKSAHSLGAVSKETIEQTKFKDLANGQAREGSFSMFLNGKEYTVEIEESDTLKNVIDKISEASGNLIQANVDDNGIFSIKAYKKESDGEGGYTYSEDTSAKLSLGSSADKSNFASALKMHEEIGTYGYNSSYALSTVNTNVAMRNSASGLGEIRFFDEEGNDAESGTVSINGVEFTID